MRHYSRGRIRPPPSRLGPCIRPYARVGRDSALRPEETTMFISPAYAQSSPGGLGGGLFELLLPMLAVFAIFYFLMIRPQQQRMKQHRAAIDAIRRGDTVVTAGGLVGKVTKVKDDGEL